MADPEPQPALPKNQIRVVVRREGTKYIWNMYDDPASLTVREVETNLVYVAKKVDKAAGLTGPDSDGISRNQIVFSAAPEISAQYFHQFLEMLVVSGMYLFVVELTPAEKPARRLSHQLPLAKGLGSGGFQSRRIREQGGGVNDQPEPPPTITLRLAASGEVTDIQTSIAGGKQMQHPDATLNLGKLRDAGWQGEIYAASRKQLALALRSRQEVASTEVGKVEIVALAGSKYATWGELFLALDAVKLANKAPDKGKRPNLFASHKFTNAFAESGD